MPVFAFELIPHPVQTGEYVRGLAPPGGAVATAEVPAKVLVGVGGAVAGAVGSLHGVQSLEDLLLRDALYVTADGGDSRWLAGLYEAAHDGKDGGRDVLAVLAEDVRALLAHENHRARKSTEYGNCVVSVAQEEAAFFELQ